MSGLRFGVYSDSGHQTCGGYTGSLGYEKEDAAQFAAWGVDLLKYDDCFIPSPVKVRLAIAACPELSALTYTATQSRSSDMADAVHCICAMRCCRTVY